MCASLLRLVEDEAKRHKAARIVGVRLGVGVFTAVESHTLAACFELLAEGTVAEGAKLTVDLLPAAAACRECGHEFALSSPRQACPVCGSAALDSTGGRDFLLTGLEAAPNKQQGPAP